MKLKKKERNKHAIKHPNKLDDNLRWLLVCLNGVEVFLPIMCLQMIEDKRTADFEVQNE